MVREISKNGKPNPTLGEKYFSDWIGFGHCFLQNLPAGDYEIFMQYAWPPNTETTKNELVKDYTVRVYAQEEVVVRNNDGITSAPNSHDYEFWDSVLEAREE